MVGGYLFNSIYQVRYFLRDDDVLQIFMARRHANLRNVEFNDTYELFCKMKMQLS